MGGYSLRTHQKSEFAFLYFRWQRLVGLGFSSLKNTDSTWQAWGRHSWSHLGPHEWIRWSQLIRVFDHVHGQSAFIRRIQLGRLRR